MSSPAAGKPQFRSLHDGSHRDVKVLSVGLPRTGSYSMCLALSELGFEDVYHCLKTFDRLDHWQFIGHASDRLFPSLPTYNSEGMTANDWEEIFGPCDAITDIAGVFAESLIECYPDAKVILVERPFERWEPSVRSMFAANFGMINNFLRDYIEPMIHGRHNPNYVECMQKLLLGMTRARDGGEIVSHEILKATYDRHQARIQEIVPPDRLLYYELGSGWGPLCEFLGREVPDKPFPHGNEGAAVAKTIWNKQAKTIKQAAPKLLLYGGGISGGFLAVVFAWPQRGAAWKVFSDMLARVAALRG